MVIKKMEKKIWMTTLQFAIIRSYNSQISRAKLYCSLLATVPLVSTIENNESNKIDEETFRKNAQVQRKKWKYGRTALNQGKKWRSEWAPPGCSGWDEILRQWIAELPTLANSLSFENILEILRKGEKLLYKIQGIIDFPDLGSKNN